MHREYEPHHHHDHEHDHDHGPAHRPGRPWLSLLLLAAVALVVWLVSGVYVVQPNERAVVWRCGRILTEVSSPGIHFSLPWGIDQITKLKLFEQKRVGIGLGLDSRDLGRMPDPRQAECLTGDRNLIVVSAVVQYNIVGAKDYLTTAADVPGVIENLTTAALSATIAAMAVDDVFTVGRLEVQQKVLAAVRGQLGQWEQQKQGLGVQVNSVTLEDVRPPQEVDQAFRDVISAREDRQRAINEAQGYASSLLPSARGEAERIRLEAEAYSGETTQKARGEADRFTQMIAQLAHGRELTASRLILETLEEVLPKLRKVVVAAGKPVDLGLLEDESQ
jgi:membrane protease subunit HflK